MEKFREVAPVDTSSVEALFKSMGLWNILSSNVERDAHCASLSTLLDSLKRRYQRTITLVTKPDSATTR